MVKLLGVIAFCLAMILAWTKANSYNEIKQLQTELAEVLELQTKANTNTERLIKAEVDNRVLAWQAKEEPKVRADAIKRSEFVQHGYASEHVAPWDLKSFSLKDFRFVGGAIDYLVFRNLTDYNDESEQVHIYLLDIKTGKAALTKRQRLLRDAIKSGRMSFATYNPDDQKLRTYPCQGIPETTPAKDSESS